MPTLNPLASRSLLRALVLSLLLGAGALALVVWWLGPDELRAVRAIRPAWLALAIGFFLASFLFAGARLAMLVRRSGERIHLRHAVRAHVLGLFASTVTPGGSGGMPAVALVLQRQGIPHGAAWSVAVAATTADTVFYGWSLPVALVVLRTTTGALDDAPGLQGLIVGVAAVALVVAYLLAFRLAWLAPIAGVVLRGRLARFRPQADRFIHELVSANERLQRASWRWHGLFHLLVAGSWSTFFLVLWASARGFGVEAQPLPVVAAMSIVAGVGSLFPTPGGSGFFEFGASLALLSQSGRSGVAAAVVVWRAVSHYSLYLIGPMLGGYLVVRTAAAPADAETAASGSAGKRGGERGGRRPEDGES